jgi:hypothetical protein
MWSIGGFCKTLTKLEQFERDPAVQRTIVTAGARFV